MNAKEALSQSKINAQRKAQEAQERLLAEKLVAESAERIKQAAFFQSLKSYYYPEAIKAIEKTVKNGLTSTTVHYGTMLDACNEVVKYLTALGYETKRMSTHYDYDRGDPDSGEGACDAHWEYRIEVSWDEKS